MNKSMERNSSGEGARPKTSLTAKRDFKDFEAFLMDTKGLLTEDDVQMLATAFEFKRAEIDTIERSEDHGQIFVDLLKRKGLISRTDVTALTEKLKLCDRRGVADDVNESFQKYLSKMKPQEGESQKHNLEKKNQFVTELRNKYQNLCGDIPPAPFLRDRYNIEELYVESGMEFMEGKEIENGGKEKWKKLKNYKTIFTDHQVKSKRRIIDGEPGSGKSMLALQIAHDWCKGISPVKDFDILILLRLRQFSNVPSVFSAIKRLILPRDSKLTENDIKHILDSSSTLILLDGYDEYPDRGKKETDIEHIIRGDMFQKHEVILTTRKYCLPPKKSSDTKRIRSTGFDDATRDTYVRNIVARGCSDVANKINSLIRFNPISVDLCKIPLFFSMICYMANLSEKFRSIKTVTEFFRHLIKCFHSHKKLKTTDHPHRGEDLDHTILDMVTFGLFLSDAQQISCERNELRDIIGHDLYDEYISVGILIEEESFNYENLEYFTETRFFHKMFAEWYAAHFFATIAAQSGSHNTRQPHEVKKISLKNLNPNDVQYLYRFACGLNSDAAANLIKYLSKIEEYHDCTLLCITELDGNYDAVLDIIMVILYLREIYFSNQDSLVLQRSNMELLTFANSRMIYSRFVFLEDCIEVKDHGKIFIRPSNLPLPPIAFPLDELKFEDDERELTEEDTYSILQYATECQMLKRLKFHFHHSPPCIRVDETLSLLKSRGVNVVWVKSEEMLMGEYHLNFESGQWNFQPEELPDGDMMCLGALAVLMPQLAMKVKLPILGSKNQ